MKHLILLSTLLLCLCASAQESQDTLFLEMTDNSVLVIPEKYIEEQTSTSTTITYYLKGDSTITVKKSELLHQYTTADSPFKKPVFLSYKFNNKFNDQLFTDTDPLEIDEANNIIKMQVACIGKRLTPSFKLTQGANAYVGGVVQESKKTRLRFDKTIHYTVAYPNQSIYKLVKNSDKKYTSNEEWTKTKVELTGDMFTTNAPSNHGEDPVNMLDGNINTIFHSTWGEGTYTKLAWSDGSYYGDGVSEWPYLEIELPEPLYNLQFSYTTRSNSNYAPLGLILQASNDGTAWTDIRSFTDKDDGLPTTTNATYTSPTIELGQAYNRLRLQLTAAQHKNYLVFSEFSLYKMEATTQLADGLWETRQLGLTPNRIATNTASSDGIANLIDGTPSTYYTFTKTESQWPYLQITMPETTYNVQFAYTTALVGDVNGDGKVTIGDVTELVNIILGKNTNENTSTADVNGDGMVTIGDVTELVNIILGKDTKSYAPLSLTLQGSTDGNSWSNIKSFTATEDALPTTSNTTYLSPVITTNEKYAYLRLLPTASQDDNKMLLGELKIYTVEDCKRSLQPYGTDYNVVVDFLTDHPTSEYSVPRIDIWFGDSISWSSTMWIGRNGKTTYEDATIKIDGAGVYPNMDKTFIKIKGRGNSSWSSTYTSKNPYRLKFFEINEKDGIKDTVSVKVKPFGMTKGKSWVLLANKQAGSMTTNAIAMKIADMVESRGCNHIVPVELYINNQYRGSYNFTEKVGFSNNSIDIDSDSIAAMLELDTYTDETIYRDATYNLPFKIKEPDFEDVTTVTKLTIADISNAFNHFTKDTKSGGLKYLDVDAFVRAMLVNDFVRNEEYKHPKSWFLYNENVLKDSVWSFGPVWDFDWAYGYDNTKNYFISNAETDLFNSTSGTGVAFYQQLLRGSDVVKKAYYKLWTDFMESGKLDELIEYCDDYYDYVKASFVHNNRQWSDGNQYATQTANAKNWLKTRAEYIYRNLTSYDLSEDIIETKEEEFETTNVVNFGEVMAKPVNVYSLNGILVRRQVPYGQCFQGLPAGIYIVRSASSLDSFKNGRKVIIE